MNSDNFITTKNVKHNAEFQCSVECIQKCTCMKDRTNNNRKKDLPPRRVEFLSKIITFNLCLERESKQIATCHVMSTTIP